MLSNYIQKQVRHYQSGRTQGGRNDALYRIASYANLIGPGEDKYTEEIGSLAKTWLISNGYIKA